MTNFIPRYVIAYIGLLNAIYNGSDILSLEEESKLAEDIQNKLNAKCVEAIVEGAYERLNLDYTDNPYFTLEQANLNGPYIKLKSGVTSSDLLRNIGPYYTKIMAILFSFVKERK